MNAAREGASSKRWACSQRSWGWVHWRPAKRSPRRSRNFDRRWRAHQVLAHVVEAAHEVAKLLVRLTRHERKRQLAGREQPHEALGVTAVGLDPIPRCAGNRSRCCDPQVETALARRSRQPEARRAGLIDRAHRSFEALEELKHHRARRATQPLDQQLAADRIEDRRDRLGLMDVEPYEGHTLRHGRHLP